MFLNYSPKFSKIFQSFPEIFKNASSLLFAVFLLVGHKNGDKTKIQCHVWRIGVGKKWVLSL